MATVPETRYSRYVEVIKSDDGIEGGLEHLGIFGFDDAPAHLVLYPEPDGRAFHFFGDDVLYPQVVGSR